MAFRAGGYVTLAEAAADGVQHLWRFDESSGTSFADSIGDLPGSVAGDPAGDSIVAGAYVNARRPNGPATDHAIVSFTASPSSSATIAVWTVRIEFSLDADPAFSSLPQLIEWGALSVWFQADGKLAVLFGGSNIYSASAVSSGRHTLVLRGDSTTHNARLDGVDLGSAAVYTPGLPLRDAEKLFGNYTNVLTDTDYLRGWVDEAAVWNRWLTDAEADDQLTAPVVSYDPTGAPALDIEQVVDYPSGIRVLALVQRVVERGAPALDIEQVVALAAGAPALDLEQRVTDTGAPALDLQQSVWSDSSRGYGVSGQARRWRPVVTLAGVDVSTRLTGSVTVDAEEGSARVAEFTLRPAAGAVSLTDWVGVPVTIDFALVDSAGADTVTVRLFTGLVDVPEYDPRTRLTTYQCTDHLQAILGRLPRATLETLLGGYWSEYVFDAGADAWQVAQDRLSTRPASYDLDATGCGRLADWAAASTPDFTFGDAVLDESIAVELAERRDLHNRTKITFEYRFQRDLERRQRFTWSYEGGFCSYFTHNTSLPSKEMILEAAAGGGWLLTATPSWTPLPPTRFVTCGGNLAGWVVSEALRDTLVLGADLSLARRWSQTLTRAYTLTVQAPESIAQLGPIEREETGSASADTDDTWEATEAWSAKTGGATDANGDTYWDRTDTGGASPTDADTAMETLIARARTAILAAHRANRVAFDVPLHPGLERHHTVRVEHAAVTAQGKVRQLVHTLDIGAGTATTTVTLAVSKTQALGLDSDPIAAPTAPSEPETVTRASEGRVLLGTYIGGLSTSPPYDEDWRGYTGNAYVASGVVHEGWDSDTQEKVTGEASSSLETLDGTETYPEAFVIGTADIEADAADPRTLTREQTITVAIPDDTLTMAA